MTHNTSVEFYLIRHAQSDMNTNPHLVGGRSNETPLTEKGITQALQLGEFLKKEGILPTAVYASPAKRTQETARHSLSAMGLRLQPIINSALHELSQGSAEGTPRVDVYTPDVLDQIDILGKDFKLDGGESMNDVGVRMVDWVSATAKVLGEDDRVFAYTHGGAITYLASRLQNWPHQKTYEFQKTVPNTSITKLRIARGELSIDYIARADHIV